MNSDGLKKEQQTAQASPAGASEEQVSVSKTARLSTGALKEELRVINSVLVRLASPPPQLSSTEWEQFDANLQRHIHVEKAPTARTWRDSMTLSDNSFVRLLARVWPPRR